eukprot:GHUV01014594.1.p1 GENE.GHUV01014594.1~~GHUV01014594.1.p1  ORF type:complete len:127 (+),score=9.41 GHUV01014594.1:475-855(+)
MTLCRRSDTQGQVGFGAGSNGLFFVVGVQGEAARHKIRGIIRLFNHLCCVIAVASCSASVGFLTKQKKAGGCDHQAGLATSDHHNIKAPVNFMAGCLGLLVPYQLTCTLPANLGLLNVDAPIQGHF